MEQAPHPSYHRALDIKGPLQRRSDAHHSRFDLAACEQLGDISRVTGQDLIPGPLGQGDRASTTSDPPDWARTSPAAWAELDGRDVDEQGEVGYPWLDH